MRIMLIALTAVVLAMFAPIAASAATTSGSTTLLSAPVTGSDVGVLVSVTSDIPVVPYEYAIENVCNFSEKVSGNPDSIQRDSIVYWTSQTATGAPQTTMTVHLQSIPTGSACKVFLIRNNTIVKGSTTVYTVG